MHLCVLGEQAALIAPSTRIGRLDVCTHKKAAVGVLHHGIMVWCGVVWCGVVWCGVVWCGVVWCGVVWYGTVRYGMGGVFASCAPGVCLARCCCINYPNVNPSFALP